MTVQVGTFSRNAAALFNASFFRWSFELNTTQCTSIRGRAATNLRIVPPQPISISSQCAPTHNKRRQPLSCNFSSSTTLVSYYCLHRDHGSSGFAYSLSAGQRFRRTIPDLPWSSPAAVNIVEHLLIFEGVHSGPEAIILVSKQLSVLKHSLERLV